MAFRNPFSKRHKRKQPVPAKRLPRGIDRYIDQVGTVTRPVVSDNPLGRVVIAGTAYPAKLAEDVMQVLKTGARVLIESTERNQTLIVRPPYNSP